MKMDQTYSRTKKRTCEHWSRFLTESTCGASKKCLRMSVAVQTCHRLVPLGAPKDTFGQMGQMKTNQNQSVCHANLQRICRAASTDSPTVLLAHRVAQPMQTTPLAPRHVIGIRKLWTTPDITASKSNQSTPGFLVKPDST